MDKFDSYYFENHVYSLFLQLHNITSCLYHTSHFFLSYFFYFYRENTGHAGEGQKSLRRATAVIGMAPDIDPDSWDHSELDRYGLGKERELSWFYKIFLIDPIERKTTQLCPFVKSGIMHKAFQPYLKEDGLGIDYSKLIDYDTKSAIETNLKNQHPYWIKEIKLKTRAHDKEGLSYALQMAQRIGLDKAQSRLYQDAMTDLKNM